MVCQSQAYDNFQIIVHVWWCLIIALTLWPQQAWRAICVFTFSSKSYAICEMMSLYPENFLNAGGKGIWTEADSSLQEEEHVVSSNTPEKYTLVHLTCSCANGENRMRLTGRCHIWFPDELRHKDFFQSGFDLRMVLLWLVTLRTLDEETPLCACLSAWEASEFIESSEVWLVGLSWRIRRPGVLIYYNNEITGRPIKLELAIQEQIEFVIHWLQAYLPSQFWQVEFLYKMFV